MTKSQRDKIISIIEKDSTFSNKYFDWKTDDCCVIGGLLQEAKFNKVKLREEPTSYGGFFNTTDIRSILNLRPDLFNETQLKVCEEIKSILENYGIGLNLACTLQQINDSYSDKMVGDRRKELIKRVMAEPLTD